MKEKLDNSLFNLFEAPAVEDVKLVEPKTKKNQEDKTKYTEDSIVSLTPLEFTRLRPATYLGSNEYSTQLVREVFSNALDEHMIGHGKKIIVEVDTVNNVYCVEDFGQGFPINVNKGGETVLQAAFDRFNTSGKYSDDGVYAGSSLGLNGIGAKLTNFLSKWLEVISYDGDRFESLRFSDGKFESRQVGKWKDGTSGTKVKWSPDPQFFQNVNANEADLNKLFEEISALCPDLTIEFKYNDKVKTYHSEHGIQDLLDKKVGHKEMISNRFCVRKEVGTNLFDISMTYTTDYYESITAYVNYGLTESGVHIGTVKSLIARYINKFATDNNLLKKNDDPLSQSELAEGLVIVFNVKTTNVKYDSQTKVRVVDLDKTIMNQVMNVEFQDWLANNPKIVKQIVDKALLARKAKEAAQNAKERIRGAQTKGKKFINLPTKLVDAYSKRRDECELFITEGDSAANGLIAKRDGKTQAVFPIRGKILSCRKATSDKVYANQEIANIVKALGLDIEKSTGKLVYDAKKLRYSKIIFAADGDADGYDIRLLLINAFWWLCPDLLSNGHVYVALPPLFRVTTSKNEYVYLKDERELSEYKRKHKSGSYIINRNKGLGEQSADELAYCLLKPNTRNVQQLTVEDAQAADDMLECFMGNKVEPRRDYLLEHAHEVKVDME